MYITCNTRAKAAKVAKVHRQMMSRWGVEHCHSKASLLRALLSPHASPPGAFVDRHCQGLPAEAGKLIVHASSADMNGRRPISVAGCKHGLRPHVFLAPHRHFLLLELPISLCRVFEPTLLCPISSPTFKAHSHSPNTKSIKNR